MSKDKLANDALRYHSHPQPGKLEVIPTKPLTTQEDLSLAYTPGVADVCKMVEADPEQANAVTAKGNLVLVVTNGTAVLGLGDIGPTAAKPVMEGKAVLFKKFANIDVFDIEIDEKDPYKLVDTIAALEPTCGGINLEDIKAPECFIVEQELEKRMNVPVFHDDQHGTGIIAVAAFINALKLTGKKKEDVKIVFSGAGAAGLACVRMLLAYGVPLENITITDLDGVVYKGRPELAEHLEEFANDTKHRTLADAIVGADVFYGLSAGGVLKKEMVAQMADQPIVFAMANPTPEIMPNEVLEVKPNAIVGTGRSDFPNQVNNVLCFPYVFRGALDCGATTINMPMKLAAAEAIAELARKEADASLDVAYKGKTLKFGPEYVIPKPFDSRLVSIVAPAIAKAAMDSGVANRPIEDLEAYANSLKMKVDQSFALMRQIFTTARKDPKRVAFPEGEEPRILRAAQTMVNEGIAHPIIVGRENKVLPQIKQMGLSMKEGVDFTYVDPNNFKDIEKYAKVYYDMRKRDGILPPEASIILSSRWAALCAMMVRQGDADAMVAGITGRFDKFLRPTKQIIGTQKDIRNVYGLQLIMHKGNVYFIGDTSVNVDPSAEQLAEMCKLAAEEVKHFGIEPRIALVSHSNFGSSDSPSARKMRKALSMVHDKWPELNIEGEMQADAALDMAVMGKTFPSSQLKEPANVLIMPSLDAASITYNVMKSVLRRGEYLGPIMLGMNRPVHILSLYATVRQIVNMTALAVVEAQAMSQQK